MRKYSFLTAHSTLFNSALMSAAVSAKQFRTAHVQFYLDLYSNFLEYHTVGSDIDIQAVQINRAMETLQKDGYATIEKTGSRKTYRLLPSGFLELIGIMTEQERLLPIEETLFLNYLIKGYGHAIREHLNQHPNASSLAERFHRLLDPKYVIECQLKILEKATQNVDKRIQDYEVHSPPDLENIDTSDEAVAEFVRNFPFRLSYRKSLEELFEELPKDIVLHEITQGFTNRKNSLLKPLHQALLSRKGQLETYLESQP